MRSLASRYLSARTLISDDGLWSKNRQTGWRADAAYQCDEDAGVSPWLNEQIECDVYFGRIVELDGEVLASIGLMVIAWPPHPMHPSQSMRGYILNLFVEPAHRRKGIGRNLMGYADRRFSDMGIQYPIFHSPRMAREMYESLGWKARSELALVASGLTQQ